MNEEHRQWTPFEHTVAGALRQAEMQRTPDCLEPDELLDLMEWPDDHPHVQPARAHLTTCLVCAHEYARMRTDFREAEQLQARIAAGRKHSAAPLGSLPLTPFETQARSEMRAPLSVSRRRSWRNLFSEFTFRLALGGVSLLFLFSAFHLSQQILRQKTDSQESNRPPVRSWIRQATSQSKHNRLAHPGQDVEETHHQLAMRSHDIVSETASSRPPAHASLARLKKLASAHRRKGEVYAQAKRYEEARREYQAALDLRPDDNVTRQRLETLSHTPHP